MSHGFGVPLQPPANMQFWCCSHAVFELPLHQVEIGLHVDVVKSVAQPGAFMQSWFVMNCEQSIVSLQVVAVQLQPLCAVHDADAAYAVHAVGVPVQRSVVAPSPGGPSGGCASPSTAVHDTVLPLIRHRPSLPHVRLAGHSSAPWHGISQSENAAPY